MQTRLSPPTAPSAGRPVNLMDIVQATADLPALPAVALATHKETGRAEASAASVAALVARDPALAGRVLKLANSAYYGVTRRVGAVQDAVVVLGMRGVRNLCLLAGTYPWLQRGLPAYALAPGTLWTHSLAVGLAAQTLATRLRQDSEAAFTAGLLHDLGKVTLSSWLKNLDKPVLSCEAERARIGVDHAMVGGAMLRHWNLPEEVAVAVERHHYPNGGLSDILHVADVIGYLLNETEPPMGNGDALKRLGLEPDNIKTLVHELAPEHERQKSLMESCA